MKQSEFNMTIKMIEKNIKRGRFHLNYYIQRPSEQWNINQKSLLIRSVLENYPVPPLYCLSSGDIEYILDGKQRLTTFFGYINNEFKLVDDMEDVIVDGKTYSVSECYFEELHEDLQDIILSFSIHFYKIEDAKEYEVEEMFYRLNNGTQLNKIQKARSLIGKKSIHQIRKLVEHQFMLDKAYLTDTQLKHNDDEFVVMQSLMLVEQKESIKGLTTKHVVEYIEEFKKNDKVIDDSIVSLIEKSFDYLNVAFEDVDRMMLKKSMIPYMTVMAVICMKSEIHPLEFRKWIQEFKRSLKGQSKYETKFNEYTGMNSSTRHNVTSKFKELICHAREYTGKKSLVEFIQ